MKHARIASLDLAKGLTLLSLPAIHTTLMLSSIKVHQGYLGQGLAFIAESAGAPLFMLVMGITIATGRKRNLFEIFRRTLLLFLLAYILNSLKFIVPALFGPLPQNLFTENSIPDNWTGYIRLLLTGDILQLAAISYLVCSLLKRYTNNPLWTMICTIIIIVLSPVIWKWHSDGFLSKYIIDLVNGLPPNSFFPVFPWMAYPLAGQIIGQYLTNVREKELGRNQQTDPTFRLAIPGIFLILSALVINQYEPISWTENYYRLGISATISHIGIVCLLISGCSILIKWFGTNRVFQKVNLLSKNINACYIFQWVIVCWELPIIGYHQLDTSQTLLVIELNTLITVFITLAYSRLKRSKADPQQYATSTLEKSIGFTARKIKKESLLPNSLN